MKRTTIAFSVLLAAIIMVGVFGTAAAQGPNPNDDRGRGNNPHNNPVGVGMDAATMTAIAERLGITTDEMQAFIDEGQTPVQVAAQLGVDLTPLEVYFLDNLPVSRMIVNRIERETALAEALGITTDELRAYLDAGLRLPEIADEVGADLTALDWPLRATFMDREDHLMLIAEAFGITADELQAYLDNDLTIREIAEELGIDLTTLDLPFYGGRDFEFGYGPRGDFNFGPNNPNNPNNGRNNNPPADNPPAEATPAVTATPAA